MYEWQTIKIILHISIKHKLSLRMSHNYHYLFKYVVAGETSMFDSIQMLANQHLFNNLLKRLAEILIVPLRK